MDFSINENQRMIADAIKQFGAKHIVPNIKRWDEAQEFPIDMFKELGELGVMGIVVPKKYGGAGFSYTEYVTATIELGKICGSIGLSMAAHNSLCVGHILTFGSEEQKNKYLPKLASGEHIGAWGLTESVTGSDASNMITRAVKDGDHYIITGSKSFITHAISGNVVVIIARTGEKGDSRGMSAFIIEEGTPGFTRGKKEDKLGMRASETGELIFDGCRVHKSQMMGEEGEGFQQAMKVLDSGRISIAALSIGIAKGAYEAALKYSQEREQFNQPICNFQGIAFKLADMAMEIEAAELLTFNGAERKKQGLKMTKEGAYAKYYSSEVAVRCATEAVQIFGGYGYTKDYPVEKFYRDAKLCTIGEGTSEIQKIVIARKELGRKRFSKDY